MDPARWQRVEDLFHAAEALHGPARDQFLAGACGGDESLRSQVESLIASAQTGVLEQAVGRAAQQLARPAEAIQNYRILGQLGEGGMGVVFEAEQQSPRRRVALKLIRSGRYAGERARRQFEREAEALGRLRHPAIATIYESGTAEDGQPYLAMELVSGMALDKWLETQPAPASLRKSEALPRLHLFRAICDAVIYAHQHGIIHRDLKPSNIFIPSQRSTSTGVGPSVKILDFGLARFTDPDPAGSTVTETGLVQGSLPFMSPEQARGETDRIDTRADIYSLGVILYWLLTHKHPYLERQSATVVEAIAAICMTPPAPFRRHFTRFDSDLETIAGKALAKEPERRYQTAAALLADIDNYIADLPIVARPPSAAYQVRKLVQRHRAAFAAMVGVLTLLIAFTVATLIQSAQVRAERDRANQEAAAARQVSSFLADLFRNANPRVQGKGELSARDLLVAGRERLDKDLEAQPEIRARLLDNIGGAYSVLGPLSEAKRSYEDSIAVREKALGQDSLASAASWDGLSTTYHNMGEFANAVEAQRHNLRILEKHHKPTDPKVVNELSQLSVSLAAKGDFEEAEQVARRVVEADRTNGTAGSGEGIDHLESLGGVLRMKEDFAGAIPVLREAVERLEKLEGEKAIGGALNELGIALNRNGQPAEAEKAQRRLIGIASRVYGPDNLNIAIVKTNLAISLFVQNRVAEAEAVANEALALHRKNGGTNPRIADVRTVLADIRESQGRAREALQEVRSAYEAAARGFGAAHFRTALIGARLGRQMAINGQPREGLALLEKNAALLQQGGRSGTLDRAIVERLRGEALRAAGEVRRSRESLEKSLELLVQRMGPDHPETRKTRAALQALGTAAGNTQR